MDDSAMEGLRQALKLSPNNAALLRILLHAHVDRAEFEQACALGEAHADALDAAGRLLWARAWLEAGRPDEAIRTAGDSPEGKLLQARALVELDRMEEARAAYQSAIGANPALDDPDLLSRLAGRVRTLPKRITNGPKLTVISNDDTSTFDAGRALQPPFERVTFADIGGLDEVKEQIRRKIILPFQKPSLFERFRKRAGGGILLYGPPGCGKTLIARATAGECKAAFHNVAISDVLDMYIGESERKLRAVFERARATAPCVLFFDEMEALGGRRQHAREAMSAKIVSQFLAEMDGFAQNNAGVLVLGATNVPWAVDSAFRRPGRFDRVQFVPPPDRLARETILRLLLQGRPVEQIDVTFFAAGTAGFSGADLRHLVETAVESAIEASISVGREVPLSNQQLRDALKVVRPTTTEWLTTARNYARYANDGGQYDDVLSFLSRNAQA